MMLQPSHWLLFKKSHLVKAKLTLSRNSVNAQIIVSLAKKKQEKKTQGLSIRGIVRKIDIFLIGTEKNQISWSCSM